MVPDERLIEKKAPTDRLAELTDLAVLPLRVRCRAADAVELPPMAGSTLRGAFGGALKDLVCVHRERETCPGCPQEPECAYARVFEPRAAADQVGAGGFGDLPRPYVLRCLSPGLVRPGEVFQWDSVLIGSAISRLAFCVMAWRQMGERGLGRGRGRFLVDRISAPVLPPDEELVYDGGSGKLRLPELSRVSASPPETASQVVLRFRTPTRLKHEGRFVDQPGFTALWQALQLRLSILRLAHGGGRPRVDFAAALERAGRIRLLDWQSERVAWERFSRRQDRRVPMTGFTGTARYSGDLAEFLPALRMGEWIGVGDNCTFGQGQYEVDCLR